MVIRNYRIADMKQQPNIEQHLLDFSADQETPYVPFILQGRLYKRISKEEIRGWSSAQPAQPFQNQSPSRLPCSLPNSQTIPSRTAKTPTRLPRRKDSSSQLNSARDLGSNQTSTFNSLFKTFQRLPELASTSVSLVQNLKGEIKIDFIHGKKLIYPKARSTLIVRPFFTSFFLRNNSCKAQNNSSKAPKMLSHGRQSFKSAPKEKTSGLSMTSYPIDSSLTFDRNFGGQKAKFSHFIRKLKH